MMCHFTNDWGQRRARPFKEHLRPPIARGRVNLKRAPVTLAMIGAEKHELSEDNTHATRPPSMCISEVTSPPIL